MIRLHRAVAVGLWVAATVLPATAAEPPRELLKWLQPQKWERDVLGPVVSLGKAGEFDDQHIFAPAVAEEGGRFSLWYSGSRGTPGNRVFRLGLATSSDGKLFEKHAENPVLQFTDGNHSVLTATLLRNSDGSVLREYGKLRLWFASAMLNKGGLHTLHESTSADGIHWAEPSPVLLENVYCPSVLKTDRGYEMWFSDVSRRPWIYRHATSSDGTKWNVTPKPVLYLSQDWEAEVLVYPTVLKIDNAYLMWYGSYDRAIRRETTAIGFAASLDGLTWHKNPSNPVLRPDPSRPWESNYVGSGCVLRLADGSFRYWYASRKAPPFLNLYFAINTARWTGAPNTPQVKTIATPQHVAKYLQRCEELKAASIKTRVEELKSLTGEKLAAAQAELKRLQEEAAPLAPLPLLPTKDDIGIIAPPATTDARHGRSVDVLEIVAADDAILRVWYPLANSPPADDPTYLDLWVHGIDTSRLAVGQSAKLPQVFHVAGSKLFDTTCGKRSMVLLEPIDIEPFRMK